MAETLSAAATEIAERSRRLLEKMRSLAGTAGDVAAPAPKPHPIKACLTHFDRLHFKKFNEAAKIDGGKDSAIMKRLLATYSEDKLLALMEQFFQSDDEFVTQRTGFTIGAFSSRIPALISSTAIAPRTSGVTNNTRQNGAQSRAAVEMIRNQYGHGAPR
jgi:hypothetical protein